MRYLFPLDIVSRTYSHSGISFSVGWGTTYSPSYVGIRETFSNTLIQVLHICCTFHTILIYTLCISLLADLLALPTSVLLSGAFWFISSKTLFSQQNC